MVIFYKKWKKYNEIQLTKNKMDLNIRKMTNHPPSPASTVNTIKCIQIYTLLYVMLLLLPTESHDHGKVIEIQKK